MVYVECVIWMDSKKVDGYYNYYGGSWNSAKDAKGVLLSIK